MVEYGHFGRLVHGGERCFELFADVAAGQVVAAQMGGEQQQALAILHGGFNVLPAVDFGEQAADVCRLPATGDGELQAAFHGFLAYAQYVFGAVR